MDKNHSKLNELWLKVKNSAFYACFKFLCLIIQIIKTIEIIKGFITSF